MSRVKTFLGELKRRKVYSVGVTYAVTAWVASMGAAELFPYFGIPDWAVRAVIIVAVLGFPIAVVLAWAFEVTPGGVMRDADAVRATPPATPASAALTTMLISPGLVISWEEAGAARSEEFKKNFRVGRDAGCDVRVDDSRVSRIHSQFTFQAGTWWIEDMSSSNGTFLDGRPVGRAQLPQRCAVQLAEDGPILRLEQVGDGATTTISPASS